MSLNRWSTRSRLTVVAAMALSVTYLACGDDETAGGTTSTSTSSTSSQGGGSTTSTTSTTTSTTTGAGGQGGGSAAVHGCTLGTATDMTGGADVNLTWDFGHDQCIIVDSGTKVIWTGNFTTHPLRGGVSPTPDSGNAIEMAGPGSGSGTVEVTFATAGDYPYYCGAHTTTMTGVVYVL
jgi:plastocyanin